MIQFIKKIKESKWYQKPLPVFIRKCISNRVWRSSAALAYYFLISFFPLILFFSLLLSSLSENVDAAQYISNRMIPSDVIDTIISLLDYSSGLGKETLMYSGVIMSLYGGSRAVACLREAINKSYGIRERRNPVLQFLINLGFSALFLTALIITLLVIISTPSIVAYLGRLFGINGFIVGMWSYMRFVVIFIIFLALLTVLYSVVPGGRLGLRQALPGAFAASFGWMVVSMAFSLYVSNMARYSIVYGSIGAMVVLMLWLYFTGAVLITGAEFNNFAAHFLLRRRIRKNEEK